MTETTTRQCTTCSTVKPITEFVWRTERNGYRHKCLECERKRVREKYTKNKAYFLEYGRAHKFKRQVRDKARTAIESGKLIKMPCEVCGEKETQAHHDDYLKPLEVRFLCQRHHAEIHRGSRGIDISDKK